MSDPLSVGAAVVGLLTAAAGLSKVVNDIVQRGREAPKELKDIQVEVEGIRNILEQLQIFILGEAEVSRSRSSLILVNQMVTTLTGCVMNFSALEAIVGRTKSDGKMTIMARVRWISMESELSRILGRLQMHKSSLSLMLSILTCKGIREAESKADKLYEFVREILKSDPILAQRLQSFDQDVDDRRQVHHEGNASQSKTTKSFLESEGDSASPTQDIEAKNSLHAKPSSGLSLDGWESIEDMIRQTSLGKELFDNGLDPHAPGCNFSAIAPVDVPLSPSTALKESPGAGASEVNDGAPVPDPSEVAFKRDSASFVFEELLKSSRPYRKAAVNDGDTFSLVTAAGRTASWSLLSGLSCSEVSNIAVVALPIYSTDLKEDSGYKFGMVNMRVWNEMVESMRSSVKPTSGDLSKQRVQKRLEIPQFLRRKSEEDDRLTEKVGPKPVFGVALSTSILYAGNAIQLVTGTGEKFVYGYVPFIVTKCGSFLKQNGINDPNIFANDGHPGRILALERVFNTAPTYGKGHHWASYTADDSAGILLRYLKSLPEPIIPRGDYESWTLVMRLFLGAFEGAPMLLGQAIESFQSLIGQLPPANRHLLLYLLDLLAFFSQNYRNNKMTSERLVAAFQPSLLCRDPEEMDETEYRLALDTLVFLTDLQDKFMWDDNHRQMYG